MNRRAFFAIGATAVLAPRLFADEAAWTALGRDYAEAFRALRPLPQLSATHPAATLSDAYTVQRAMVERLLKHEEFVGIKGAFIATAAQKFFGLDAPAGAVLFRSGWHAGTPAPTIENSGGVPVIETEIGFILGTAITRSFAAIAELQTHIRALVAAIELPAAPHAWTQKETAADFVSVNVDSRHYIVGPEHPLTLDPDTIPMRLTRGGEVLNETRSGEGHRGQWWSCLSEVNWAVSQGYTLLPGHLIITGAIGKKPRGTPGDYHASFGALGEIHFTLRDPEKP